MIKKTVVVNQKSAGFEYIGVVVYHFCEIKTVAVTKSACFEYIDVVVYHFSVGK